MISAKTKTIFVIVILVEYFLLVTGTTSADIFAERTIRQNKMQATTLSFSDRHTANESQKTVFFNVSGFLPQGFDLASVRVKKDGKMNFKYHVKTVKKSGDDEFCHSLNLEILPKNGATVYQGSLSDLSLITTISDKGWDDWLFFISLDSNQSNLKNKNCEFEFSFNTFRNSPEEQPTGFFAQRILTNTISSGNW